MQLFASLFYVKDGYSIGPVKMDLALSESHTMQSDIGSHRIEDGSEITDHIRNQLRTGQLTAMVSNFSINQSFLERLAAAPFNFGGAIDPAYGNNRAKDAYTELVELWNRRQPVTIVTALQVYENVAIEQIEAERSGDTGDAQQFRIRFRQLARVKLQTTQIVTSSVRPAPPTSSASRQASPPADLGRSSTTAVATLPTIL